MDHSWPEPGLSRRLATHTLAPPLSRSALRGYGLMRWITLSASIGAPLIGLKHPLHQGGVAALVAGVVAYVLLVNYQYGRRRCDQALPLRLPPVLYTTLCVALIFALMTIPSEATNGQSLWFCVMFFVVIGETRHFESTRSVVATVAASGLAVMFAVAVALPAKDRLMAWLGMLPLLAGLAATAYGNQLQQQQEREHSARLAALIELRAAKAELEDANRRLTEQAATVEELAIANERNRMARELHDVLGYTLATVVVKAEAARRLLPSDPERVGEELIRIQEVARSGLSEVRRSVGALRQHGPSGTVVEHDGDGWDNGIAALIERTATAAGLRATIGIDRLPPGAGVRLAPVLFRVIQESLTNVIRHAAARSVVATGRVDEDRFILEIADDGRGIAPGDPACGFGVRGMRERVGELGGTLQLISAPGTGVTVRVSLPLGTTGCVARDTDASGAEGPPAGRATLPPAADAPGMAVRDQVDAGDSRGAKAAGQVAAQRR